MEIGQSLSLMRLLFSSEQNRKRNSNNFHKVYQKNRVCSLLFRSNKRSCSSIIIAYICYGDIQTSTRENINEEQNLLTRLPHISPCTVLYKFVPGYRQWLSVEGFQVFDTHSLSTLRTSSNYFSLLLSCGGLSTF